MYMLFCPNKYLNLNKINLKSFDPQQQLEKNYQEAEMLF